MPQKIQRANDMSNVVRMLINRHHFIFYTVLDFWPTPNEDYEIGNRQERQTW